MSWKEMFNQAVELVELHSDLAEFFGPASEEDISAAEALLALNFPESYVAFLKKFGVGNFSDAEFFGIISGNVPADAAPCAIWFTIDERRNSDFPEDFVVMYSSGFGPLYCLATSESKAGDCPVREWNYEPVARNRGDLVSASFAEFFLEKIKERI